MTKNPTRREQMTDAELVMERLTWNDDDLVIGGFGIHHKGLARRELRDYSCLITFLPTTHIEQFIEGFVRPFYLETKLISSKTELRAFMEQIKPILDDCDRTNKEARATKERKYKELLATK
jgi:hypothetical protein